MRRPAVKRTVVPIRPLVIKLMTAHQRGVLMNTVMSPAHNAIEGGSYFVDESDNVFADENNNQWAE